MGHQSRASIVTSGRRASTVTSGRRASTVTIGRGASTVKAITVKVASFDDPTIKVTSYRGGIQRVRRISVLRASEDLAPKTSPPIADALLCKNISDADALLLPRAFCSLSLFPLRHDLLPS